MLGNRPVSDLAAEFGTPFFLYDLDEVRRNFEEAHAEFGDGVAYATKAFLSGDIVAIANRAGMSVDVSTDGEYEMITACGFPTERIVVHGNNKSSWLIRKAIEDGVQWIVVDNEDDIAIASQHCQMLGTSVSVVLRVNPGIEVHTHEFSATGNRDSKFGFPIWTDEARRAIDLVSDAPGLEFQGLHTHIGSLVYSLENFELGLEALSGVIKYSDPTTVIAGGGLGVRYLNSDIAPTFREWAKTIRGALSHLGFKGRTLVEPGRSMVANAAVTVYSVGVVRELDGRTFVSVDGGMSDNPRPLLYDSGYEAFLADDVTARRPHVARLVGSHCESGDTIIREASLQRRPIRGDIICTPVTGAYGLSMASNYNRMRRPAVVYVSSGSARLGIRRESFHDLRRNDLFFS
jgi:diaminopimelate decarboxylase